MKWIKTLQASIAAIGALQLSGCAIVSSHSASEPDGRIGIPYMLPKALLPVELVEAEGVLVLRLLEPKLVGDTKASYVLYNVPNVFSSDDVKIEVDVVTGLLKSVKAHSTDETGSILKQIAMSTAIGRAEKAAGDGESAETVLYSANFDPDGENSEVLNDLTQRLNARVQQILSECSRLKKDTAQCHSDGSSKLPAATTTPLSVSITAKPMVPKTSPATGDQNPPSVDCSVGICHRGLLPYKIDLEISGLFKRSDVIQLPNGAPILGLPLSRAAFVTTKHDVVLKDGRVESHAVDRPSSTLQVVKTPLDIYEAVLTATSKLIALRIGANEDEVKRAQSDLDTVKALKRIEDELVKLNQPKSELGGRGDVRFSGPSERGTLMSVAFGTRNAVRKATVTAPPTNGIVVPPAPAIPAPGQPNLGGGK